MGVFLNVLMACSGKRPQNLGAQGGLLAACPQSPNCVTSQAVDEGHRIPALAFSGDPDAAFARLKLVLGQRSDTTIIEDKHEWNDSREHSSDATRSEEPRLNSSH